MNAGGKLSRRSLALVIFVLGGAAVAAACASTDDEVVAGNSPKTDAGADTSFSGGAAGVAGAGSSGTAAGGVFGSGGSGGSSGSSGSGASGTAGEGTCSPSFCPGNGVGTPCCVTPGGPCGIDNGMGCVGGPMNDI